MTRRELPKPYIFELDTPLILFNGRLLQPKSPTEENNDYAQFNSKKFSLEEIITPKKLEQLYFRNNHALVEEIEGSMVRQYFNSEFSSRENISQTIKENKVMSLIAEKILPILSADMLEGRIESIMSDNANAPAVPQRATTQQRAMAQNVRQADLHPEVVREMNAIKQKLISKVEEEYKQFCLDTAQEEDETADRINQLLRPTAGHSSRDKITKLREDTALSELLKNNNLMVINDKIYSLVTIKDFISYFREGISRPFYQQTQEIRPNVQPESVVRMLHENKRSIEHKYFSRIENKLLSSKLKINNKYYLPILWGKTADLEDRYVKLLEKRIKIEAIEHNEYQTRMLARLSEEKRQLEELANSTSYERNNAGFFKRGNEYFVYIITPPYALRSPHVDGEKCYVPFGPAKIGVRVRYLSRSGYYDERHYNRDDGGVFEISDPMMIDGYRHPFVGSEGSFTGICLGQWGYSSPDQLRNQPPEQKVLTLLAQAKKTLMMGYRTGGNPYPSNKLLKSNWSTWLSKAEVDRKGLVVLNDFTR
jgi:hypothetical protein